MWLHSNIFIYLYKTLISPAFLHLDQLRFVLSTLRSSHISSHNIPVRITTTETMKDVFGFRLSVIAVIRMIAISTGAEIQDMLGNVGLCWL
jgi:hypothetical protein